MTRTRSTCLLVLTAMVVSTLALVAGPVSGAGADTPPPAGYAAGTSTGDDLQGTESFQDEFPYLPEGIACFKTTRSVYSVRGAGTYEGVTATGQPVVYTATLSDGQYPFSDGPIHIDVENTEVYYHGPGGTYGDHVKCTGDKAEVPAEFRIWATDHIYQLDGGGNQVPCVGHGTFARGMPPVPWQAQWTLDADCTVVGNEGVTPVTGTARAGTGFTHAGSHGPCFDECPNNIIFDYTQYLPFVGLHVGVTGPASAKVNTQAVATANLTDDGAPVAGAPITFSVAGPAATTPAGATVATGADGRASFSFTTPTVGDYTVTASTPSETPGETVSGTLPVQFTPPPPPTVVLSGPSPGQTDEATPALATFTDNDAAVANVQVNFSVTGPGAATPASASINTNSGGKALFNFSGNRAGDYTVTASVTYFGHPTSDTHTVALAINTFYREAALSLPSTEKAKEAALIDPAGDYAYFGSVGGITKVDLHTFQRVGVLTLPSGESAAGPAAIDPAGVYAYFLNPISNGGSTPEHPAITKVDLRTFQRVGVLNFPQEEVGLSFAAIDPAGHYLYTGSRHTQLYPVVGTIIKVNLDTFEWADVIPLGPDDDSVSAAVISPAGDFAYFGTVGSGSGPAHVVKVNLATFTKVGSVGMAADVHSLLAAVIDPAGRFAYFSTDPPSTHSPPDDAIVKIDLTSMQQVAGLSLSPGDSDLGLSRETKLGSAVIDPAGNYAYFANSDGSSNNSTFRATVVKIDLRTFSRVHAIRLNPGENLVQSAAISPDGTHAYFGSNSLGKVVKVALTRPPNPALVAANDAYATDFVMPLTVAAPGVLANDVDTGDGDPLAAGQASDPAGGTVVLNANGSFTYTPDGGFSGTDTFTYTANDAKDYSPPATVSIAVGPPPSGVQSVGGGACGYYTHVGLFGGPPERRGCGQTADVPAGTSPSVSLPPAGSAPITATKPEGAMGLYGPAAIFSGQWPADASAPSNSGPLSVSTQGSTGTGGSATSSADVVLFDTPLPVRCYGDPPGTTNCSAPGGIGPGPVIADEAHSSCVADESGLFGSASFVNGIVELKYDVNTQLPIVSEPIPTNPPPNYTRSGTLDHVGDSYTVVFNEQILGPDSITVNAVHMYLLGPIAVGEMVVAQSRCAITPDTPNAAPVANDDAYSVVPGAELVVAAAGVLGNDTDAQALAASKVLPTPPPASGGGAWTFGSDPAHGTLELGSDGSFTYTPDAGFEGTDTFAYQATDPRGASDQATVTITVAPPLGISASPASVNPGAPVTATWTGIVAPTATDWVGLYDSSSAPDPALLAWAYTGGSADGSLALTVPAGATPGATYELRLFSANSYDRLATSAPFAVVASVATLSASPASANPGAPVTATWSAIVAPTATDWVGLYNSSAAPDAALLAWAWAFTNGSASGSVSLTVPAGATLGTTYELRLFSANSYTRLATSAPFSVVAAPQSATMLADINPGSGASGPFWFNYYLRDTSFTGLLSANGTNGSELWKTDGTAAGTTLVKDIRPGTAGSGPGYFTNLNGTTLFMANDGTHGTELWKSDGTAAGTVQVADINPGAGDSIVVQSGSLTAVGNTLFFTAADGTHGIELWKSDGTAAGTVMVKDINPGSSNSISNSPYLIDFNGTLLFAANDGTTGKELWKSDGTAAGTVQVADMNPGSAGSSFWEPVLLDGVVYFGGTDATHGSELWRTDGTTAGTAMVFDYAAYAPGRGLEPEYLTVFNGSVYFSGNGGNGNPVSPSLGQEPWKSDGTAAGTVMVKDIVPGAGSSTPDYPGFVASNGSLFFSATDGAGGRELWKTDGTDAGTVRVKDINPGTGNGLFSGFYAASANSLLYFAASDGTVGSAKGLEVWQSDGTAAGTVRVADIRPGTASSSPQYFTNVGGTVYFTANDGTHGVELWRLGSPAVAPPAVSASPATVAAGSPVTATWSNVVTPGPTDWVGLYPTGSTPDSGLVAWAYTNGAAGGSLNLTVPPGSAPGATYELRLFSNNSYTRLATSAPISVTASTATIAASPLPANPGAPLTATWGGIGAPTGTDWVGLYDSDSAPNPALLAWAYTNGTAAGSVSLFVPAGASLGSNYELRLFANNSYVRIATSAPFSVAVSNAAIAASPSSVTAGSPVTATWSGIGAPTVTDWVGLYASSGAADPAIVAWAYTGGAAAGTLNLTVPPGSPPGATYELRLYSNNSYTRLATSAPFSVT